MKIHLKGHKPIRKKNDRLSSILFCIILTLQISLLADEQVPLEQIQLGINLDSLLYSVKILSGEIPATLNGQEVVIKSRNYAFQGNEDAAQWIRQILIQRGYTVQGDYFGETGHNLFAIKKGTLFPDHYYIICAHYDSWPESSRSPGADDNASGVSIVLEAARILSNYKNESSLIFGFWDEEELGYVGARHYIESFWSGDAKPLGVINIDMVAWDGNDDDLAIVNTHYTAQSHFLSDQMDSLNTALTIGLNLKIYEPRLPADHQVFWDANISAIGLVQDYLDDPNEHYHSSEDKIEYYDIDYYERMAHLCILTFASLGGIRQTDSYVTHQLKRDWVLSQNYPNPFNSATTVKLTLKKATALNISIYNINGSLIHQFAPRYFQSGTHMLHWQANDQSSGVYFYRIKSDHFNQMYKMILQK